MSGVSLFYEHLFANEFLFYANLLLIGSIHYFLFRKYVYSFFDPFFLTAIVIAFYSIDVFFMYEVGSIHAYYFVHFVITQFLFISGFLIFKPINIRYIPSPNIIRLSNNIKEEKIFFYIVSLIFIFAQSLSFIKVGLPILMEARLSAYQADGGNGALGRIVPITLLATTYLLIGRTYNNKQYSRPLRIYHYFLVIFCTFSFFSTGSKSSILVIVNFIFLFGFFNSRNNNYLNFTRSTLKLQKIVLIFAVASSIAVIIIENLLNSNLTENPILLLIYRFVQSGDIYMMAYQDDVISYMQRENPLIVMFADLLGMLRIIPWDQIPKELGNQLNFYHTNIDLPKGPNPVHNVFGLFYFGYFPSLFYSFLMGFILSFIRNKLIYKIPCTPTSGTIYAISVFYSPSISIDFTYSVQVYGNILFILFPLILFTKIFAKALSK